MGAPQITMAVWLTATTLVFAGIAVRPVNIRLDLHRCSRVGLFGAAGAIGEAATLWWGGFFG